MRISWRDLGRLVVTNTLQNSVEQILEQSSARPGDQYMDDFGNCWVVHDDRDGLRLEHRDNDSAWIPYWTASVIRLPGFRKASM